MPRRAPCLFPISLSACRTCSLSSPHFLSAWQAIFHGTARHAARSDSSFPAVRGLHRHIRLRLPSPYPFLQELVQILVRQIVHRLVTDLGAHPSDFLRGTFPRRVIVQEAADLAVAFQDIRRLGQVAYRIEHHTVRNGPATFQREIGQVIHEPLEYKDGGRTAVTARMPDVRDVLRRSGAFEIRVPYLHGSPPVPEAHAEIPFATHPVMHFHAFPCGDVGRDAPPGHIVQQYRIAQGREAHFLERGFRLRRFPRGRCWRKGRETAPYPLQHCGEAAGTVEPLRQVDDAPARPLAEIMSQIEGEADLERRGALLPERGMVPQAVALPFHRRESQPPEEILQRNPFRFFDVHK